MTAEAGSRYGTGGTSTSPAPSMPRLDEPLEPVPDMAQDAAVRPEEPDEPEGPDEAEGPDSPLSGESPELGGDQPGITAPAATEYGLGAGPAATVGAWATDGVTASAGFAGGGTGRGAIPHTSQKPSSPTFPPHPGWPHGVVVIRPSAFRSRTP
ncbi:hypothetical protein GCM10010411_67230 [Actinomadura fulvescens]|uniref:Uncharacterized protein n=1 Tax=Actinomadura fulvescens TaxID=46160 RepID=A0ABP6CLJ5_9ACTN